MATQGSPTSPMATQGDPTLSHGYSGGTPPSMATQRSPTSPRATQGDPTATQGDPHPPPRLLGGTHPPPWLLAVTPPSPSYSAGTPPSMTTQGDPILPTATWGNPTLPNGYLGRPHPLQLLRGTACPSWPHEVLLNVTSAGAQTLYSRQVVLQGVSLCPVSVHRMCSPVPVDVGDAITVTTQAAAGSALSHPAVIAHWPCSQGGMCSEAPSSS